MENVEDEFITESPRPLTNSSFSNMRGLSNYQPERHEMRKETEITDDMMPHMMDKQSLDELRRKARSPNEQKDTHIFDSFISGQRKHEYDDLETPYLVSKREDQLEKEMVGAYQDDN